MQVSVEAPSKIERRITIVVPVEKLDEAFNKRIASLSKTAKVKGYRQGKVPVEYLRQYFGQSARQESLSDIIQSSLYSAMANEKLNPVATPVVTPKAYVTGQPLEFVATFEVVPEIGPVKFEVKTIEKQTSSINEADIEKVINHLREQHGTWRKVDRAIQEKDQVILDFRGSMDGKAFENGEAHDYPIVIGSKTMIPGFEEGLLGAVAGEERVLSVTFPENYFAKEFAGKPAEFAVKVHKISEPILPEINAAFVKKLGVKSGELDDLRIEVRKNLERELNRLIQAKLKTQVFNLLLEQNSIDIPNALIEREANRVHDQMHPHHQGQQHNHSEEEMQGYRNAAKRNVILGLLVAELVKKHNITPDKTRVQEFITAHAAAYQNPEEIMALYTKDKRQRAAIEMQILEEQLVEKLLESVQVIEKKLDYSDFIKRKQ